MFNSIDHTQGPLKQRYLDRLSNVIDNALGECPRTMAVRVDLHLPEYRDIGDSIAHDADISSGLMKRFIESLDARINAHLERKRRNDIRVRSCNLRYAWVREFCEDGKAHYHVVLFVNKDTFMSLGSYAENGRGLASLIQKAWLSALRISGFNEYRTLVHFPENPRYYLNINANNFRQVYEDLSFRLSYFAKERTKSYSREIRSFGCSQK